MERERGAARTAALTACMHSVWVDDALCQAKRGGGGEGDNMAGHAIAATARLRQTAPEVSDERKGHLARSLGHTSKMTPVIPPAPTAVDDMDGPRLLDVEIVAVYW